MPKVLKSFLSVTMFIVMVTCLSACGNYNEMHLQMRYHLASNYIYTYTYIVDDKNFPNNLYDPLKDIITSDILKYEEYYSLEFELNEDGYSEEREIIITDLKENGEKYLIDLYIPYKIIYGHNNTKETYVVLIPVYTFLATKILIHVADAPSHDSDVAEWNEVVLGMASKGIRIITVASSGFDKKTEYLFRNECILTNGCYGYITDFSGIGDSHIDATVENQVVVEYLNNMLVRLIHYYYTGELREPEAWGNNSNQQ